MKYEVIPQEETVIVKMTEDGITTQLSLLELPEEDCSLVEQSKKDVLGELDLEKMISDLDHCVDLLQITFNAVDGFKVQSDVQGLSNCFLDAMTESNATAFEFKLATKDVLDAYINAYGNLFYGEVDVAMMILIDIKGVAARMVEKADKLVGVFHGLTKETNLVLQEVMNVRADDEEKRNETRALINELQGSLHARNALKENLHKDIEEANAEYEELKGREMKQEERAYHLQLASMIIGGVSGLFGAVAEIATGTRTDRDAAERETASETAGESREAFAVIQAKRDYAENISKQEQNKYERQKLEERIDAIDRILDRQLYQDGDNHVSASDLDAQKTAEELRNEKRDNVVKKGQLNSEFNKLKGEEEALGKVLSDFGIVLDELSEETKNAAKENQKAANSLAERMESIQKQRNALKDQERENLVKLAEYAAKMQNMVMDESSLDSAIQCLVIAVGCLRRVLAYLHEIKLFWANVETFCNNLACNDRIDKMIKMQENKEPKQRAAYFKTSLFVKGYLDNIVKWQALHIIFKNYLAALASVSKRMTDTMEQSLSADRKEQWKLATQLSGELNAKLKDEIIEIG